MKCLVSCVLAACTLQIAVGCSQPATSRPTAGDTPAQDPPGALPGAAGASSCTIAPPVSPARRLTRAEYNATVRDLLGETSNPAEAFPAEVGSTEFGNDARALDFSRLLMEQYYLAAQKMAARVAGDPATLSQLLGCDAVTAGEQICATSGIERFGARAYRRPLLAEESQRLLAVYQAVRADSDFAAGIQAALRTMLQAPQFLYRVELGLPEPSRPQVVKLDHYEVASRLSYLIWGSMPDDALFAAAAAGTLGTREEVLGQAKRLLADPRARELVSQFHRLAFKTGGIDGLSRDAATFPSWLPGTGRLLAEETRLLLDHVTFDATGSLSELLTAPYTFLNQELAAFYGVAGSFDQTFVKVELAPGRASGFLTQAGPLALLSGGTLTNPVRRGAFIRGDLLCDAPPPPPADLMVVPPEPMPGQTTRESFKQHSSNPACAGCHALLDPLGFAFEGFDAAGLPRATEAGKPVDTTGELTGTDVDGAFQGAPDLLARLAPSQRLGNCYVKHWYEFGYGRGITAEDECALTTLTEQFSAAGLRVQDLILALTQIESFSHTAAEP